MANPFDEQQKVVVILTGASLLTDGIGNLVSIFWTGIRFRRLKRVPADPYAVSSRGADIIDMEETEVSEENAKSESRKHTKKEKSSKIVGSSTFFRKKAAKEGQSDDLPVYKDCETEIAETVTDTEDEQMTDTESAADIEPNEIEESKMETTEPVQEITKTPDEE